MEFRTGVKRYEPPLCQPSVSSLSQHTQSLLVYNNKLRLKKTTTSHSHSHSHTGGGGKKPNRLQQRSWDEMPRDILIKIFNLLPFQHALNVWFYPLVCKSWLYAAVDIVYPPVTTVIDLRFLSTFPFHLPQRLRYMVYLKLVLDTRPQTQWTALYLPDKIGFSKDDFLYIAQRTPCLQYLDWPYCGELYFRWHWDWEAIFSWKNLKGIHLGDYIGKNLFKSLPCSFAYCFKNLRSLRLIGHRLRVEEVSEIIITLFPQLEYFSLQDSYLTMDAASLVVSEAVATNNINNTSSHQVGIQTLDLRHCVFISSDVGCRDSVVKQGSSCVLSVKSNILVCGILFVLLELCSQCKVKHSCLWHSFYFPQRRNRPRPPQVFIKKKIKFFGSSSHPPYLGTTKRHKESNGTSISYVTRFSRVSSWADL